MVEELRKRAEYARLNESLDTAKLLDEAADKIDRYGAALNSYADRNNWSKIPDHIENDPCDWLLLEGDGWEVADEALKK